MANSLPLCKQIVERICKNCKKEFTITNYYLKYRAGDFCSPSCHHEYFEKYGNQKIMGRTRSSKALGNPTTFDIAWAAGIYEGEGTAARSSSGRGCEKLAVSQKDMWLLERLRYLFGGSIVKHGTDSCHLWLVTGARARGFAMTIYTFLSPRRQTQIKRAFGKEI